MKERVRAPAAESGCCAEDRTREDGLPHRCRQRDSGPRHRIAAVDVHRHGLAESREERVGSSVGERAFAERRRQDSTRGIVAVVPVRQRPIRGDRGFQVRSDDLLEAEEVHAVPGQEEPTGVLALVLQATSDRLPPMFVYRRLIDPVSRVGGIPVREVLHGPDAFGVREDRGVPPRIRLVAEVPDVLPYSYVHG